NRIDDIVMFRSLSREHIREIVDIQLRRIQRVAEKNHDLTLALSDEAKDWLADRGYDPAFGARPLKRMMQRHVANGLSEALLEGTIDDGDRVRIELADDESSLTFERVMPEGTEAAAAGAEASGDGAATVDA
ncbi:MAG: type VI secretion system ATPase TssH, partial [Salinibacter sp.]